MTSTEIDHLVKMANQIADNLDHGEGDEEVAAKVSAHLKRFWAPSMREKIVEYAARDGNNLRPTTSRATALLAAEMQHTE
jgi:formate dehydrogenase subunit delta